MKRFAPVLLLAAIAALPAHARQEWDCWYKAEARYGVPATLLYAIAKQESGLRPNAIGRNDNGSYDIGLMQINSSWLPKLKREFGITKEHLIQDACVNLMVGAWILAGNIRDHGYNWKAVGAYNARTPWKRERYARAINAQLVKLARAQARERVSRAEPPVMEQVDG